jgi:uncharacterized protein DUF5662
MKHWKYFIYLVRHKWFVLYAGVKWTKAPAWRLVIHDFSKFFPSEWFPYVDFFYGEKVRLQKEEHDDYQYWELAQKYYDAFDAAWLHHQHWNPHHWQHWILRNDDGTTKQLLIPEHFTREMVADWMGAGRAITGKWEVRQWYEKNKDKIVLHESIRKRVEELLP